MRFVLTLGAAGVALVTIVIALGSADQLVVPIVVLAAGAGGFASLLVALTGGRGIWRGRSRWAAFVVGAAWAVASYVLSPITFSTPACVCTPDATGRNVAAVLIAAGPLLLFLAAAVPERLTLRSR